MSDDPRIDPPVAGTEVATLLGFLAFHRDTLRMKTDGLTDEQLATPHPPSTMTLGGMLHHVAVVESSWFDEVFLGGELMPPFDTAPWSEDRDWEWHVAAETGGDLLRARWETAIARSMEITDDALAQPDGLDRLSVRPAREGGDHFSLRWILVHMIEEYCRHNGHADLMREALDGRVGE